MNMKSILKNFDRIDAASIEDKAVASRVSKLQAKRKQGGFTLLELLVVIAILAAIAGTATIALQDTDARGAAAAHVAMMDELNKGVRTFRVLQGNVLPNNLDSLMTEAAGVSAGLLDNSTDDAILAIGDVAAGDTMPGMASVMNDIGMTELRYINTDAAGAELPADVTSCAAADLQDVIASRGNAVVAGNIFNGPSGNGCGISLTLAGADGDVATDADTPQVAYWTGTVERILGAGEYGDATFDGAAMASTSGVAADVTAPIMMAVGFGPSSNLFNTRELGGMTSVPVYRHVSSDQYNRFIGLFHVGDATTTAADTWDVPAGVDQVAFVGVVDGAGDTKEEELGEWDGTRNTI